MSGPRTKFRYEFFSRSGVTPSLRGRSESDSDITTLTFRGLSNVEPSSLSGSSNFSIQFPNLSGSSGRLIRARVVLIVLRAGNAQNAVGRKAWIPVLTVARFTAWQVGDVGTWKGLSCQLLRKVDGCPDVVGRFG